MSDSEDSPQPNYTIELMTAADYDAVMRLWLRTPGMGLNEVDDSREGICKYLARNPRTCFLARGEGRVLGVILAGHDGRRGYIHHTAVEAESQGRGIGTALVEAALTALTAEGITKVALVVFERNEHGNEFWQHRGFTDRPDLVYRNRSLTVMRRIDT